MQMSWFSDWMNPRKGYDAAQQTLQNNYNNAQGYQNPYNQGGQFAQPYLQNALQQLSNPQALQDQWSKGYTESEAAKQNEATAQSRGLNAAQAMGLNGSSTALSGIQAGTTNIVNQDKQNYLNDLMQKYMASIGVGQGLYNTGANAAGQMGQNAMNFGQNSAGLSYGAASAGGNMFGGLLGAGAGLIGGALGGPIGSALGAGLSQHFGWSKPESYNPGGWNTGGK
jgi:hypothetical protein